MPGADMSFSGAMVAVGRTACLAAEQSGRRLFDQSQLMGKINSRPRGEIE